MRLKTLCTVISLLIAGPAAMAADQSKDEATRIPGFTASTSDQERMLEERLVDLLDPASTARHFRLLTEEPHPAGTAENLKLAHYVRDQFVAYGLEEVRLIRYDVLLPWPRKIAVSMVEPIEWTASLAEDGYKVDKDSYAVGADLTYLGMSASCFKAWEAERRGVAALIIYSDPKDDGYRRGEVFPHGPWGPESHIQRGAITYDFIVPGDPLTPGWPSIEGAKRITPEEARSVPRIPAVPMSWRDAKPILENLQGPVAPLDWQGALPMTYRVGPGPAKLHVEIDMDGKTRSIWVVEGRILGSEHPDELVILGNHRDAWVYGAVDPSSGTASQLEAARVLGALAKKGERPRRTLVFANWDAEEWHLTGSTEWGEQFAAELGKGAVAYLNVDSSTSGPNFSIGAVASLNPSILEVARDVIDPNSRRSLLEAWSKTSSSTEGDAAASLVENELGSGSDYTVFLNFLGVPVASMGFGGPYGVYHSQYDDLYWMEHFGDPGYRYMTAMVEVWGRLGLRLANADVIPYDFRPYSPTGGGTGPDGSRGCGR